MDKYFNLYLYLYMFAGAARAELERGRVESAGELLKIAIDACDGETAGDRGRIGRWAEMTELSLKNPLDNSIQRC